VSQMLLLVLWQKYITNIYKYIQIYMQVIVFKNIKILLLIQQYAKDSSEHWVQGCNVPGQFLALVLMHMGPVKRKMMLP
jgi:hypothetical protein